VSVVAPLVIFFGLPRLLGDQLEYRWLLLLACTVFMVSWLLPSPRIDGTQTEFVTHFVGGGIFTGLLWLYIKLVKKWQATWWVEAATLFALVSSLGVLNELFEFLLYHLDLVPNGIFDTSWELVANTAGACLAFVVYKLVSWQR
jgi:glycopeptide antibiotics resistance protein